MQFIPNTDSYGSAFTDFRSARNRAELKELLALLTGETTHLLSFDEVRKQLKLKGGIARGVREIPLDSIVGSVGRYTDFTRDFLPLREGDMERWARVKVAATGLVGMPPIDVYQIGEAYFVLDGNHRVSVARQLRAKTIQAYVTEIQSRIPLTPNVRLDDLIVMSEYLDFLDKTHLDKLRPGANLSVTIPGKYQIILEHIDVHRYFMGMDSKREIPYSEAVTHWYDTVYLPMVEIISKQGILRHFPKRTEADMYIWLGEHRAHLEEVLGWEIRTEYAANSLVGRFARRGGNLVHRAWKRITELLVPDKFEEGPPTGEWRKITATTELSDSLFKDILVPINGREDGWCALDQAILIANQEGALLHGLHVVSHRKNINDAAVLELKKNFNQRCDKANLKGQLNIAVGRIADQICRYAYWTDLVVVNLSYPPAPRPLARLSSGFRDLIRLCPRPILAVPHTTSNFKRALIAYDGSPKSQEALFIAAHLADKQGTVLFVIAVVDNEYVTEKTLDEAKKYLEARGAQASYGTRNGSVAEAILETSNEENCDLIIMGGYGHKPVLEVMLGSAVDHVLRRSYKPMLICR